MTENRKGDRYNPQSVNNEKFPRLSVTDYNANNVVKQEELDISDDVLALAIHSIITKGNKPANACRNCGNDGRMAGRDGLCLRCEQRAEHIFRTYPLIVRRVRQLQLGGQI